MKECFVCHSPFLPLYHVECGVSQMLIGKGSWMSGAIYPLCDATFAPFGVQVMREVAVLDTINPGGFYAARVRQFGQFAAASTHFRPDKAPWALCEGIEDPLYANVGGEEGQAALWATLRKLRLACAGLAQYLTQLQSRCATFCSVNLHPHLVHLCVCRNPRFWHLELSSQSGLLGNGEERHLGTGWILNRTISQGQRCPIAAQRFTCVPRVPVLASELV